MWPLWHLLLMAASAATAAPADTGVPYFVVREVVVWGTPARDLAQRLPLNYTWAPVRQPEDLLTLPSLSLRDYLGVAGVSLRGSSMEELQTLLEGFPARPAQSGYLDLNLFPPGFLRAAEVLANPLSAYFGADAMAGVLNLQVDFRPGVRLQLDGLGGRGLGLRHSWSLGPTSWLQATAVAYRGPERIEASDAFDRPMSITNLGQRRVAMAARWLGRTGEVFWTLTGRTGGLPRIPNVSPRRDSLDLWCHLVGLRLGDWQLSWTLFHTRYRPEVLPRALHREHQVDLRYRHRWLELRGAVDLLGSSTVGHRRREALQVAFRDTLHPAGLRLLLGGRLYASTQQRSVVPTATLGVGLPGGVYLLWSTGFREPTFNELYWPEDPFARGNSDLQPETSWELEVGGRWRRGHHRLQGAVFHREVHHLIQWVPVEGRYQPVNASHASLQGVEASGEVQGERVFLRADLQAFWRMQAARHLIYVPWAHLSLEGGWGPVRLRYRWIGPRWERPTGPKTLPPVHLVDAHLVTHLGRLQVDIGIHNLLNQRYQWIRGFPQPGRYWILTLNWPWHPTHFPKPLRKGGSS